ncbi:unnamed protein product [Camellia sinensis]
MVEASTVFAYGQTSSGKTFTMMGITEYAIADIYDYIEKFSTMEIYNESVKDLLSTDSTPLRNLDDPERGTFIEKLTEEPLKNWNHVMELLSICEAKGRNGHGPLRDSKLTHILQSSLEDNAGTAIICTMSPPRKVTTNAQVNVVISDAALIKHLQRELARLESELRSQGPTFVASHYSALLREKGLQIEKVLITSHACNGRSSDDHYIQILPEFEENFYMYGSQSLKLTKSRSCKASLMTSPYSPWFEKVEHNDNDHTPPNGFKNEFTGRPEDIRRRLYELNYGANIERLSRKGSQSAIGSVAAIDLEAHRGRTSTDDNITSVNTCIVHESEPKAKESLKNVKVVGLDPIEDDSKSLSNWPSEFKRLQKEIIELLG